MGGSAGHVHFVLMELLKNAMKATIVHWGPRLPEAPPVQASGPAVEAAVGRVGGAAALHVGQAGAPAPSRTARPAACPNGANLP